jgi:hypothetical protein
LQWEGAGIFPGGGRKGALNFEESKIWVWEDDAFPHHRVRPSKVDWMTLVGKADGWDFVILSRCVRKISIKQLCSSIQLWFIYTISFLWFCCSRIYLDLPDHFSKPLFHPIVTSPSPSPSQSSSPIDTDRKASQKLISLITSTLLSVVKFEFFEDLS